MNEHNDAGFDVLGLGAVAIDDLLYVDAYPPADDKTPVRSRRRQFGGLAGTALVAVARLGGRAAYAGVLGDDDQSEAAIAELAGKGSTCAMSCAALGSRRSSRPSSCPGRERAISSSTGLRLAARIPVAGGGSYPAVASIACRQHRRERHASRGELPAKPESRS